MFPKSPPFTKSKPDFESLVAGHIQNRMFRNLGRCARAWIDHQQLPLGTDTKEVT
jgi:hypothetical protein